MSRLPLTPNLQAGRLNRRITINAPNTASDAFNQPQPTWTQVYSCWAEIAVVTGKDVYSLGQGFTAQVTHRVTVRYTTAVTITAGMQVVYGARTFIVQAVSDPLEDRTQFVLYCMEESR